MNFNSDKLPRQTLAGKMQQSRFENPHKSIPRQEAAPGNFANPDNPKSLLTWLSARNVRAPLPGRCGGYRCCIYLAKCLTVPHINEHGGVDILLEYGLRIHDGLILGEVSSAELTVDGACLGGWVQLSPDGRGHVEIVVVSSGEVVSRLTVHPSDTAEQSEFEIMVRSEFFRHPLFIEFKVYAVDASGGGCDLPITGTAAELNFVRIGSRPDLLRLVQSPTERLKNRNFLFYVSYHAFGRFPDDFAAQSAMVCTMGYRLIDGLSVPGAARQAVWAAIKTLLAARPDIPRGLWLRWHTSVRLVAGYLAYREGDTEAAAEFFDHIGDFAFDLAHWPTALTNVLIGIFLAGWMRYQRREFHQATHAWRRAEGVLRYGAGITQFSNFYAYGEMSNAIKVAQECYIGLLQAENNGQPVSDPRILPQGYELDIRHLPGLCYNLGIS